MVGNEPILWYLEMIDLEKCNANSIVQDIEIFLSAKGVSSKCLYHVGTDGVSIMTGKFYFIITFLFFYFFFLYFFLENYYGTPLVFTTGVMWSRGYVLFYRVTFICLSHPFLLPLPSWLRFLHSVLFTFYWDNNQVKFSFCFSFLFCFLLFFTNFILYFASPFL